MYNGMLLEGTDQCILTEILILLSLNVSLLREPKRLSKTHHLIRLVLFFFFFVTNDANIPLLRFSISKFLKRFSQFLLKQ